MSFRSFRTRLTWVLSMDLVSSTRGNSFGGFWLLKNVARRAMAVELEALNTRGLQPYQSQSSPPKVEERTDTAGTRGKGNREECPRSEYTLVPATAISLNKSEDQRQERFIRTSRKIKIKRRLKNSHKSDQKTFFKAWNYRGSP